MTITYPLTMPSHTGIRSVEMRATNAVAYGRSPFTFGGQVFAYSGQMWQADITLPPMKRANAEQWIAWLMSLRGQYGTFLMGDPRGCTPRGTALSGRVNLASYSEQFNNAAWVKTRATVSADALVSPDGKTTADAMISDTSASTSHLLNQTMAATSGTSYAFSIYAKAQSALNLRISLPTSTFGSNAAVFNLNTGALVTATAGFGYGITAVGGGWYRCYISGAATSTGSAYAQLYLTSGSSTSFTGDGASGVYIWGAQIEEGTSPTTYQPIFSGYGPYVNGAGQTGGSLVIDGASPDEVGYLLPGDYIQLGSASTATLHKVLTQVDTDSSGNATLDLWPHIRTAPENDATVIVSNAVGRWRLASNETSWSTNEAAIYGLTFGAMEVI